MLSLSRFMSDDDEIALVNALEWWRERADSTYGKISQHRALWLLERFDRRRSMELRSFANHAQLCDTPLSRMDDHEVLSSIRQAIRDGRAIAIRKNAARPATTSVAAEMRRILAQIERETRGKLSHRGRQYKLLIGDDLARLPGRDCYGMVEQADAREVLEGIAKEAGVAGEALRKAAGLLSKDWRPPFSHPDGLVLLRRIPAQAATPKEAEAALTPSQLKTLLDAERPVTFAARFVDERGEGLSGFAGKLAHGSDPESDMSFPSAGFATATLKGERQAWLTLPAEAKEGLITALKDRWQKIRGEADDAWKPKEEALTEIVLQAGELPEVELQDGKRHTLMLRPPVAMARMHGMYFDTERCFLLPTAVPSLKKLVDLCKVYANAEILVVGHTDTSGKESYNLSLSAERADSMRAYLRDDVDAWLAWYDKGISPAKRWGDREDVMMIDALVPAEEFGERTRVTAFQAWHNGNSGDARDPDAPRTKPDGWEALKVDGIMGPKTRRQLVSDYLSLSGTTLPEDIRVVTYGCGEYFPLTEAEGDLDSDADDDEHVDFDRRVEIFFFDKPFGILPAVPGVAEGASNVRAVEAEKGSELYPEWRMRSSHDHIIQPGEAAPSVVVEWPDYLSDTLPDGLAIELVADDVAQTIAWSDAEVVEGYRRFVFDADPSGTEYTLVAHVGDQRLLLWDQVILDDPENPPLWEHLLTDVAQEPSEAPAEAGEDSADSALETQNIDDPTPPDGELSFDASDDEAQVEQTQPPDNPLPPKAPSWTTTFHAIDDLN